MEKTKNFLNEFAFNLISKFENQKDFLFNNIIVYNQMCKNIPINYIIVVGVV